MAGLIASVLVLLLALWIDRRFGESPVAIHPVVGIGHCLQSCGHVTVRCLPVPAFLLGALAWMVGVVAVGVLAWALQALAFWQLARFIMQPALYSGLACAALVAAMAWLTKSMLFWRMLRDEAGAVEAALQQSLPAGRERLSWLVNVKDTKQRTHASPT